MTPPPGMVPSMPGQRDISGTTLGGYQLVRKIAEGGMGEVYEAIQTRLSRRVALKILNKRLASRPEFIQRFEREARAAAALNHPNVVQVYDFGETGGMCYLIMEFVDGEDLSDYVTRVGRLSVEDGLAVIEQAAQALKAALQKSIIHRDIKPANLMLTHAGQVKVSDLGLAKMLDEDSDVTATGVGIGSPHFLAPEQADDAAHVDHRVDIYSLGITLLFLLTGKRPYDGASAFSVVLAHANRPLPSGLELGTELPGEVELLIRRMSAKDRDERYADYDALLEDIARVKAGEAPETGPGRGAGWRAHLPMMAGVAGILIAAILLAVFWPGAPAPHTAPPPTPGQEAPPAATPTASGATPLAGLQPPGSGFPGPQARRAGALPGPRDGMAQGTMRFPLPQLPLPNFNALQDGPIPDMLAEAETFARANTNMPVKIIDRYVQLARKTQGTKYEADMKLRLDNAILMHEILFHDALEQYKKKTRPLAEAGKHQEAYEIWKTFPMGIRNREADQELDAVMADMFPEDFKPR